MGSDGKVCAVKDERGKRGENSNDQRTEQGSENDNRAAAAAAAAEDEEKL